MPSNLLTLRSMAYNNAWANHRLLSACAGLSQAEFEAPRTGFFPSIQATLNHILTIDWFYVDALEGGTLGPAAYAKEIPCPTVSELRSAQAAVDRRLIAFCSALDENGPDRIVRVHRETRVQTERRTGCCCTCFSTISITAARRIRCSRARRSRRRSSTSFSRRPRRRCAPRNSRSWDGRRRRFGGSEFALDETCGCSPCDRDPGGRGLRRVVVLLAQSN